MLNSVVVIDLGGEGRARVKKGAPYNQLLVIKCTLMRSSHQAKGEHFNKQTSNHDKANINLAIIDELYCLTLSHSTNYMLDLASYVGTIY